MASNEELVKLIQAGTDKQANLEALWLQNTGIVHKLAASYARDQFEAEDLFQEGYFALVKAAEKYDPGQGASFFTYFIIHLNAQMRRYLAKTRSSVSMAIHLVDDVSRLHRTIKNFRAEFGEYPSDETLCKSMKISQKRLDIIKKAAEDFEAISLDYIPEGVDDSLHKAIPDPEDRIQNLIDDFAFHQLSEKLWKMVDDLSPREQEIIKEIFLQNRTCEDIGKEQGVSNQRISQIKLKAFDKIKKQAEGKKLLRMAQDVYGIAVKGTSFSAFQRTWTSSTERAALELIDKEK